jgi:biopolymer transport protein ExbD/biopolymer transport protein TolR
MKSQRKVINEINITPLTDIFLVLLIIMMVVTPMLDVAGLSVATDNASTTEGTEIIEGALVIEVSAEGAYRFGDKDVLPAEVSDTLRKEAPAYKDGVQIIVEPRASLERLTLILDECRSAGIEKTAVSQSFDEVPVPGLSLPQ